jgi:hypothetical protein
VERSVLEVITSRRKKSTTINKKERIPLPMSVLSRDRGFIALAAVVCLAAVIASTWRAHSQTRQVHMRDRAQRPMDRMIEGLKSGGAEFPVVELFQEQEASASALTLRTAAPQDVLSI